MTFEIPSELQQLQERARTFAREQLQQQAADIDRTSAIPDGILRDAIDLIKDASALGVILATEQLATSSATVAIAAASGNPIERTSLRLAGLRGAPMLKNSTRVQLVLAAAALGLGQAAIDFALAELRAATTAPLGSDVEKPHWVVADVATELEAARLLTYKAAVTSAHQSGETDTAMARLLATTAAQQAVDAALRTAGADAYHDGTVLDRLVRDVRSIALLLGTEETHRATAAEGLLPG